MHIDKAVNCVFVQHFGIYEEGEGSRQLVELAANPDHVLNMNIIRDITLTNLPDEYDLAWFQKHSDSDLADVDKYVGSGRKVAWVLGNPKDFKTVHQWCAVNRLNRYVIERLPFRSVESAMKWLEIPEGYEISYPE